MSSFTWLFSIIFWCWCCVIVIEGRTRIVIDSASSEDDSPPTHRVASCVDHIKNQDETDNDCGGKNCPKCDNGMICKANCDCITDICKNNRCHPPPSCKDEMLNQDETDIDCGGIKCPKCADTKNCTQNCDCISGVCQENICIPPATCKDNIQNQDETDIDCGGIKCPKYADTKHCNQLSDCVSAFCNSDHICGGTCDPECKNNGTCTIYSNCTCTNGFSGPTCEIQSVGLCLDNETIAAAPILLVTFGQGLPQFSLSTPASFGFSTTYTQRFEPTVEDGQFAFVNSIYNHNNNAWHTNATDHTGDGDGYMFLVNADYKPGQFYNSTINDLCIGLRYEFSVYLANLGVRDDQIKPNVRFEVRSPTIDNRLLAQLTSGDIPVATDLTWNKYGLSFVAPSSTVVLLMISNAPGGVGNDIVIDDIGLRVCSYNGTGFCPSN